MSLLATLIIGLIIGGIGGFWLQENFDLLLFNVLMGIVGAIMGGVTYFFTMSGDAYSSFSWSGTLFSIVGALLLVLLFNFLHRATPERVAHEEHPEK